MISPLRDLLLLRPIEAPGRLGLLWVPDIGKSGNKSSVVCDVLAVGPGWHERHFEGPKKGLLRARFNKMTVKPGDKVSIAAYGGHFAGDEVEHNGEILVLIRERDINGLVAA